jgi:hypothetical protein
MRIISLYAEQFKWLADELSKHMSAWTLLAPVDDPIHYDESVIRRIEAEILSHLLGQPDITVAQLQQASNVSPAGGAKDRYNGGKIR